MKGIIGENGMATLNFEPSKSRKKFALFGEWYRFQRKEQNFPCVSKDKA